MAEKPAAEKTEQPTPRRLQKARQKGQVAQSQELPSAVSIVILVAVLAFAGNWMGGWFSLQVRGALACDRSVFADTSAFLEFATSVLSQTMLVLSPVLLALCVGSVAACIAVSGLNFSAESIKFKPEAINPVAGFGKLFNMRSLVKLGLSVAKLFFISAFVWFYLQSRVEQLANLRWAWSGAIASEIFDIIFGLLLRVSAALLVIAAADVIYQKFKHIQDLKMTRQEVKQEQKDINGSPELKSRMRSIQIAMARKRMLAEIPQADAVIVNPTHVAVAIKYDIKTMNSPVVVAKGADHLAEKIRQIARAYGVPIVRKPALARTIYATVKVEQPIPENLYVAVAEVLAMIYRLRNRRRT